MRDAVKTYGGCANAAAHRNSPDEAKDGTRPAVESNVIAFFYLA